MQRFTRGCSGGHSGGPDPGGSGLARLLPPAGRLSRGRRGGHLLLGGLVSLVLIGATFACIPGEVAASPEPAGEVQRMRGEVLDFALSGKARTLGRGDPVFAGDRIETRDRTYALIVFKDGTKFALGRNSTLEVNDFVYGRADREDSLATRVLKGAFRFVSGLIAKRRPRAMTVGLGIVATIGLRGTNVGGEVEGESARVVLLDPESPDQPVGGIDVGNEYGEVTIEEPGYGTEIPDARSPPSPPRRMRLRAIENLMRTMQSIGRMSVPRPRMHR